MKKTRKLLAIILSLIMVLSILPMMPLTSSAAATSGTCGKNATWKYDKKTATLTIFGKGAIKDYSDRFYDGLDIYVTTAPWREYCSVMKTVVIKNGVTSIGANAFLGCYKINSVKFSNSLIRICYCAFKDCKSLTSISIPNSVTTICGDAFNGCERLASATIGNSVTSIYYDAFSHCSRLRSIAIPDSVALIGWDAFYGTSWYNNQPDGLVYAGKVAYKYKGTCPAKITIKDGTRGITAAAFDGCTELTSISIPDSVTSIGECAFSYCSRLTFITLPESVASIGWGAFSHCSRLRSITIPDSITSIDDRMFEGCSEITSIIIPNSVVSIGYRAFEACSALTDIYYTGTKQQKIAIDIANANGNLLDATWHYSIKKYSVTYKLNGGKNSSENPKSYTKATNTIKLKNPTRKGYTFKGWYSDKKLTKKVKEIKKGSTGNKTLYAKWSKNIYKITYKLNKGTNSKKNPKTYTVTSAISLKNPTRKGYKFKGWYSDSKFKKRVTKIAKGSTGNKTLYAKWAKK